MTTMIKNKLSKLTLRRETLSNLDLGQANGGGISQLNTARSVCFVCTVVEPPTTHLTWPQTSVVNPGTSVVNPVGSL
jgi:hypothetical protein